MPTARRRRIAPWKTSEFPNRHAKGVVSPGIGDDVKSGSGWIQLIWGFLRRRFEQKLLRPLGHYFQQWYELVTGSGMRQQIALHVHTTVPHQHRKLLGALDALCGNVEP